MVYQAQCPRCNTLYLSSCDSTTARHCNICFNAMIQEDQQALERRSAPYVASDHDGVFHLAGLWVVATFLSILAYSAAAASNILWLKTLAGLMLTLLLLPLCLILILFIVITGQSDKLPEFWNLISGLWR